MFNWHLLSIVQSGPESTYSCTLLEWPLGMILETVVWSPCFHNNASRMVKSMMIMTKSHGSSLVPWGTLEGTQPHYYQHAPPNNKLPSVKHAFLRAKREMRGHCKCMCSPDSDWLLRCQTTSLGQWQPEHPWRYHFNDKAGANLYLLTL